MKLILLSIVVLLLVICGFVPKNKQQIGVDHTLSYYKAHAIIFRESAYKLKTTVEQLKKGDSLALQQAKQKLAGCRLEYKNLEFFIDYFLPFTARPFNLPPVYEIEEPYMEYQHPKGLQLMETILFDDNYIARQDELIINAELIALASDDLSSVLFGLQITDEQIMESLRLELIRIITLNITGYDAPQLKTGIEESYVALSSLEHVLRPYLQEASDERKKLILQYISSGLLLLSANTNFDNFDRLHFLVSAALPLQQQLQLLYVELHIESNTIPVLNPDVPFFSNQAIRIPSAKDQVADSSALIILGRHLFFENALSGNGKRSCATCHSPDNYFTDQLEKSLAFDDHSFVSRNAPTLLYATAQYGQFWDARAHTLEEQIMQVLQNPSEMFIDSAKTKAALKRGGKYPALFSRAFPHSQKKGLYSLNHIAQSIAAFERTLTPMNSSFDQYMNGNKTALSCSQISGFNLFMGKAQCGTCHFAPLFNSLLPPYYQLSELEVLGTPGNTDFDHPLADTDSGRFSAFPISFYKGAFKTPTIRNVAKTAPYMHNGKFKTLEEVVQFYNLGGGQGIGLTIEEQTLSNKPLQLSSQEVKDLVSFMEALTDSLPSYKTESVINTKHTN